MHNLPSNELKTGAEQILLSWERSSNNKRKQLLEYLGTPVIISDLNGIILDFNTQAYLILGLSRDEILNYNFKILLETNRINDGHNLNPVYQFKDHHNKPYFFFINTYQNQVYQIHFIVRADGYNKPEEALLITEQRYRNLVENAVEGIFILGASGFYLANDTFCRMLGYEVQEMMNIDPYTLIPPDKRQDIKRYFTRKLEGFFLMHKKVEQVFMHKQGYELTCEMSYFSTFYNGQYAIQGHIRDISQVKRIEKDLEASERQQEQEKRMERRKERIVNRILRIVAESKGNENAFMDVISLLGLEFPNYGFELCIYENDNVLKVYRFIKNTPQVVFLIKDEYEERNLLKTQRSEFRSICKASNRPEDHYLYSQGYRYLMELILTGLDKPFGFFRCAWKGGVAFYENRLITEIILEIAIALESSLYREEIARINRKAVEDEKNKLISKFSLIGEMSTSIAHEVRNPMTTVRGLAQLLAEENPAQEPYFELMIEEIDRANTTITEFLNLATNRFSKKEEVGIISFMEIIFDLVHAKAVSRGINLTLELFTEEITVYIDPEQMKQACINIMQNALEASRIGDTVGVKINEDAKSVILEFWDKGRGVEAKNLTHIMEPFFTTKGNNSGLGLSVSYKIIRDHGGDMVITSEINRGTTVKVTLPKLAED